MFKRIVFIWAMLLLVGFISVGTIMGERLNKTMVSPTEKGTPQGGSSRPSIEAAKPISARPLSREESEAFAQHLKQYPEDFCELAKRSGQTLFGKPLKCLTDDPAFQIRKAVRDGVRDALRR